MDLNEYQKEARNTALYPGMGESMIYPTLGLCGESGEVAEKVKKILRDNDGVVTPEKRKELIKELGDVLWYISNCASELNVTLEEVAAINISKLKKRWFENKIKGSGDNR